jgi:bifunctional non-homologous end joining protein LigD
MPIAGFTFMGLRTYRAKRDFTQTPEPSGEGAGREGGNTFVIQKHHASRLHYDLRLEVGGVLKSWAVPKEPSLDPSVKRLAVQVEDHPLEYGSFHGTIPKGHYGAGKVEIWDKGTYENIMEGKERPMNMAQSLKKGHVEVELHGKRLKGAFALIRTDSLRGSKDKPQWLLIKMKDGQTKHDEPSAPKASAKARTPRAKKATKTSAPPDPDALSFTHLEKVMFPEAGVTKGDLLDYYRKMAGRLLPYLRNRPVTLERLPDGLSTGGPLCWQKNTPDYYPDWIPRVELETEQQKPVAYALVNDLPTLMYMVNQGTVTFHTWFSTIDHLDRPDFVLFDLDPGSADFADVVRIARTLHDILKKEKIEAWVKTSGKSGLHVLTPPPQNADYDAARDWAEGIAGRAVEQLPRIATTERLKNRRKGRVYVDTVQNARGHHAVPPWVVRPTPGATVSTPLQWNKVTPGLDPKRFTLEYSLSHRRGGDPMSNLVGK